MTLQSLSERYVHTIDPTLSGVIPLEVHLSGNFGVCRVQAEHDDLVIRWRIKRNRIKVDSEKRVLDEAARIPQITIPELVKVYETPDLVAHTKRYMPGQTCEELYGREDSHEKRPIPGRHYEPSLRLVRAFHDLGISGVDPRRRNLLLHEEIIGLFDFDYCEFQDRNGRRFRERRDEDLWKLDESFAE